MTKTVSVPMALFWLVCASPIVADEPVAAVMRWKLSEDFLGRADKANPNVDRDEQPTWHFLRTTGFNGPVEKRQWMRDGKYVPLTEQGENLFDSPLDDWAYRAGQRLAPLVGKITADYEVGLTFKAGDMLIAPGPEHAVVIGWRSPVTGTLEIEGVFEHAQNCCGVNSQVKWHVERGPAPDEELGFQPTPLASASSDFGSPNQVGAVFPPLSPSFQPWDNHGDLKNGLKTICGHVDQPSAALITDLKQRGLLDDVIVQWTGEFGRLPITEGSDGRDHNRHAFSLLMAGGGFRAGHIHGATDEFGYKSVEDRVSVPDLHATILYQLGLDHTRLNFLHNGRPERLTDPEVTGARVVKEVLA